MKPLVKINFDEIFANTPFLNELGSVIFGAELALKYTNASDAELKEVKVKIARSAFASFSLDYDAMLTAAQPSRAASPPRAAIEAESTPFYVETRGTDTAVDSEAVPNETDSETNFDYYPNVSQLDSEYSGSPADSEPRDYSPRSAESPAGGGFSMDVNDDFEQTVVYENYAGSGTGGVPEMSADYRSYQENVWEPESGRDETEGLGKIRWTTYSSADRSGDEPSKTSSNPFSANPKNENSYVTGVVKIS